jgi:ferredoxin-nitrate reductase
MTTTRDSIRDVLGPRAAYAGPGAWPQRTDERTLDEPERWVKSVCLLCSTGCGLDIGVKDGRIVGVRGGAEDRVNRGCTGGRPTTAATG